MTERRIGVAVVGLGGAVATTAVVGLGGAVATTAVVGVELLRLGVRDLSGLPLADRSDLVPYESLIFDGWDLAPDDLGQGRAPAPGGGAGATGGRCGAGADVPALRELAEREQVPVAGKDGKTGQTMVKTVLAPAFRSRALAVEGWYSTNILARVTWTSRRCSAR